MSRRSIIVLTIALVASLSLVGTVCAFALPNVMNEGNDEGVDFTTITLYKGDDKVTGPVFNKAVIPVSSEDVNGTLTYFFPALTDCTMSDQGLSLMISGEGEYSVRVSITGSFSEDVVAGYRFTIDGVSQTLTVSGDDTAVPVTFADLTPGVKHTVTAVLITENTPEGVTDINDLYVKDITVTFEAIKEE